MHLSEVRVVSGRFPGCVVEGRFSLVAPHYPGSEPISLEGAQISFFMRGASGAWLKLNVLKEDAPGLFAPADWHNHLSLHFPTTMNLEQVLSDLAWGRVAAGSRRLEGVALSGGGGLGHIMGQIPVLEVEAKPVEAGLEIGFRGEVGPLTAIGAPLEPPSPVPALADSRIEANFIVPWAFLALQELELAGLGNQFHKRDERVDTPFDFGRPGLSGVAFDRNFGWPYCEARFIVQGAASPSSFVSVQIRETELVLRPVTTPLLLSDGFTVASTRNPALTLFGCGPDAWAKILNGGATGSLTLSGDGVGRLTEASHMGHVVGHHVVSVCRMTVTLDETKLTLTIVGEVDRMLRHDGPPLPPKLGPRFEVEVLIPKAFLMARGIDLRSWADQQRFALEPYYG
uniref:hypothetical protein n=1 Tax=uncultured Caulobacter sp. TaxID=158749 RepID=UPI0025D76E06|nr:hypothetical protein [uncultured Caulobacter sp.]